MNPLFSGLNPFDFAVRSAEDFILTIVAFIIVFGIIAFTFAREYFLNFLRGLLLSVGRVFSSPFIYIRQTAIEISRVRPGILPTDGREQYLITRAFLVLRGGIAILGIGILSLSFVKGCNDFRPNAMLREMESSAEKNVASSRQSRDAAQSTVNAEDKSWVTQKDQLLRDHAAQRTKNIVESQTGMKNAEVAIAASPNANELAPLKALLERESPQNERQVEYVGHQASQLVEVMAPSDPIPFNNYITQWTAWKINSLPEGSVDLRLTVQPDYKAHQLQLQQANQNYADSQSSLAGIQRQMEYHPEAFLLDVLLGVLSFIWWVWLTGLISEAGWLGVCIARDVRLLRKAQVGTVPGEDGQAAV